MLYEALLKSTAEYQKIAESLHNSRPGGAAWLGRLRPRPAVRRPAK